MKQALSILLWATTALAAHAGTPAELLAEYRLEAAREHAGFQTSARRGAEFYTREFGHSPRLPSCASCHTSDPRQNGRHAVTDKPIQPLSPQAETRRFTDRAKVEKWFRRNCSEVVGRPCTAMEKADLLAWLVGGQ